MKTVFLFTVIFLSFASVSQQVYTFDQRDELNYWYITNDTVMGGVSDSSISFSGQSLVFRGQLRLENNGGFASTYRSGVPIKLAANNMIAVRVKGDGRTYQLRLRTPNQYGYSYKAEFKTVADSWTEHCFVSKDFTAVWRGRKVQGAPTMRFDNVKEVGFLLADKQSGQFALEVQSLSQY